MSIIGLLVAIVAIYLVVKIFIFEVTAAAVMYVLDHPIEAFKSLCKRIAAAFIFALKWEIKPVVDIVRNPGGAIHTYCYKDGAVCGHRIAWYIFYYWILRYAVLSVIIQVVSISVIGTSFLINVSGGM